VILSIVAIRIELTTGERFFVEDVRRHGMTNLVDIEVHELTLRYSGDEPKIEASKGELAGDGYFPGAFIGMHDLPRWLRRDIANTEGTERWFGCQR
jgi:hypothetical protein